MVSVHKMTSKVIWGEDVNEKIGDIDYINIDTGIASKMNIQRCYSMILPDIGKVSMSPLYLFLDSAKYFPFGKMERF